MALVDPNTKAVPVPIAAKDNIGKAFAHAGARVDAKFESVPSDFNFREVFNCALPYDLMQSCTRSLSLGRRSSRLKHRTGNCSCIELPPSVFHCKWGGMCNRTVRTDD